MAGAVPLAGGGDPGERVEEALHLIAQALKLLSLIQQVGHHVGLVEVVFPVMGRRLAAHHHDAAQGGAGRQQVEVAQRQDHRAHLLQVVDRLQPVAGVAVDNGVRLFRHRLQQVGHGGHAVDGCFEVPGQHRPLGAQGQQAQVAGALQKGVDGLEFRRQLDRLRVEDAVGGGVAPLGLHADAHVILRLGQAADGVEVIVVEGRIHRLHQVGPGGGVFGDGGGDPVDRHRSGPTVSGSPRSNAARRP